MKTEIIYEDKDLFVIRKPAGLATQTARVGQADVVSELKNYMAASGASKPPYLGIVHRLDQPVEGLLVFAKNQKAAGALTKQLGEQGTERSLNKQYYAILCGKPSRMEGDLVDYMYKDMLKTGKAVIIEGYTEHSGSGSSGDVGRQGSGTRRLGDSTERQGNSAGRQGDSTGRPGSDAGNRGGITPKKAVLQYSVLQTIQTPSGEEISLADVRIDTGRFHQIRAQMAHAGMALLGDEKYADEAAKACSHRLGIRTVALCARSLAFVHPVTGEKLCFETRPRSEAFSFFKL